MTRAEAKAWRAKLSALTGSLPDETALANVELFESWRPGETVTVGTMRRVGETLYRCVQGHTTQADWTPEAAPSLWAKVLVSMTGEILPWEQPESTNPYMIGDKVTHGGKTWQCTSDNNVWEPGVFGWTEVV